MCIRDRAGSDSDKAKINESYRSSPIPVRAALYEGIPCRGRVGRELLMESRAVMAAKDVIEAKESGGWTE